MECFAPRSVQNLPKSVGFPSTASNRGRPPAVPGLERIRVAGEEMRLLVEVTTGIAADGGTIRTFVFPDRPRPPGHSCARLLRARAGAGFADDQNRIVPRAVIP